MKPQNIMRLNEIEKNLNDLPECSYRVLKNIYGICRLLDPLKSMYEIDRKSNNWWHRIFFHFLDITVVNSYILYTMMHDEKNPCCNNMKNFRLDLITALVSVSHQKQTESLISSPKISLTQYLEPVKLKFIKHKVTFLAL